MSEVLIEGVWRPAHSGAEQVVHNPATLKPVAVAPYCDAQDVVSAMTAARRTLENWRTRPREERSALLVGVGRELSASAAAIAELQALETGQAYRECLEGALLAGSCFTRLSARDPRVPEDGRVSPAAERAAAARALVLDQDYPLLHWASTAVPWLLEGSTLACVAPRAAPLAVLRAVRCTAGLPRGVVNMLVASPEAVTAVLGDAVPREPAAGAGTALAPNGSDAVFVGSNDDVALTLAGAASLRLFHSG